MRWCRTRLSAPRLRARGMSPIVYCFPQSCELHTRITTSLMGAMLRTRFIVTSDRRLGLATNAPQLKLADLPATQTFTRTAREARGLAHPSFNHSGELGVAPPILSVPPTSYTSGPFHTESCALRGNTTPNNSSQVNLNALVESAVRCALRQCVVETLPRGHGGVAHAKGTTRGADVLEHRREELSLFVDVRWKYGSRENSDQSHGN